MRNAKLCLGLSEHFGLPFEEQIRVLKKIGFEGFFAGWREGADLSSLRRIADEEGMIFQSVHAPFGKICDLWHETPDTPAVIEEQLRCLRACAENGVPVMVCHVFIGFTRHEPTPQGPANFDIIVNEAEKLGVRIAFENTEGEEYLDALMDHYKGNDTVGFCWDTGHELCYNRGRDMTASYGSRLLCTHLNDNLGIRDFDGSITWLDDLHLLPFDGIADWQDIADRLNACGYDGILTFELNRVSKPGRADNEPYVRMDPVDYLTAAYARACRVAALKLRGQK